AAPAQCSIVCPEARYAPNRLLPAFPTRRSSDLPPLRPHPRGREAAREDQEGPRRRPAAPRGAARRGDRARRRRGGRLNPAPVTGGPGVQVPSPSRWAHQPLPRLGAVFFSIIRLASVWTPEDTLRLLERSFTSDSRRVARKRMTLATGLLGCFTSASFTW